MKNWGFRRIFLTSVVFLGVSEPPTAWNCYCRHSASPLSTLGCAKGGGVRFSEEPPSAGAASHVHFDEKLHDSVVMVTPEGDGNFMVKVCLFMVLLLRVVGLLIRGFWKQGDIVTLIWRKWRTVRTAIFSNGGAQHHGNSTSAGPRRSWSRRCQRPPDRVCFWAPFTPVVMLPNSVSLFISIINNLFKPSHWSRPADSSAVIGHKHDFHEPHACLFVPWFLHSFLRRTDKWGLLSVEVWAHDPASTVPSLILGGGCSYGDQQGSGQKAWSRWKRVWDGSGMQQLRQYQNSWKLLDFFLALHVHTDPDNFNCLYV